MLPACGATGMAHHQVLPVRAGPVEGQQRAVRLDGAGQVDRLVVAGGQLLGRVEQGELIHGPILRRLASSCADLPQDQIGGRVRSGRLGGVGMRAGTFLMPLVLQSTLQSGYSISGAVWSGTWPGHLARALGVGTGRGHWAWALGMAAACAGDPPRPGRETCPACRGFIASGKTLTGRWCQIELTLWNVSIF
jgi:hypothetical protein